jgi:dienelactone hydrolase
MNTPLRWIAVLALLTAALPGTGQAPKDKPKDKPKPGDAMIEKYLAAETDRLSERVLNGAATLAEWQAARPRLYREYMDMLGLWPLPEKTPLKATVTGKVERGDLIIEKLHYQSKPGLYVTANLYRPKVVKGKLPAVLYVCGHSWRGRDGNKSAFQDHGMWFAANGYVCLILDTLQLGEIPGVHHGTYGTPYRHFKGYGIEGKDKIVENRWWWLAAGYTPAGVECWNGVRGIDYLVTRPEVDAERIAVTGISGGGAATFWIAAADERVKCAVPVSGMSDLESYVKNKVINGHCDCMFLINTYGWEWTTIAALVAPRPLLFANSDNDPIFPMDGNRRIIARLRKLYGMYGKPELVDEYVSKGGHYYRPDLRIAIFKWINKHIKNDTTTPVKDSAEFKPLPGKELRVFPTDADIPKDSLNGKIDETFVPQAKVELPAKGKFEEWKRKLLGELKAQSFRAWPDRIPPATDDQLFQGLPVRVTTERFIKAYVEGMGTLGNKPVIFVTGWDTDDENRRKLPEKLAGGITTGRSGGFYLELRGVNKKVAWTTKSPPNYVERAHSLLGRTVDQGKVWDIIAGIRWGDTDLREKPKKGRDRKPPEWMVIGYGRSGVLAAYAAFFEPKIKHVVIIDPPKSHKEGPYFLNVLRVLDIPEVLGLLAPDVRLTLINARDPAFDRVEQIYRLAGAADKLTRK